MEQRADYNKSKLDKLSSELNRLQIQVKTLTSQLYYKDSTIAELQQQLSSQIYQTNAYPKVVGRANRSPEQSSAINTQRAIERKSPLYEQAAGRRRQSKDSKTQCNEVYKPGERQESPVITTRNRSKEYYDSPYHNVVKDERSHARSPYRGSPIVHYNDPPQREYKPREARKESKYNYNEIKASYETVDSKQADRYGEKLERAQDEAKARMPERKDAQREQEDKEKIIKNVESNLLALQLDKKRVQSHFTK
eukprot:TRINITY_DN1712_c0_g2_i11.p1 TRINITY_DN1712_c0_g2~~TRINITY_DN1712_c0_g2_i11.p1  ORF type:complete len:251 (-),score=54.76 TRINITY_DN1712_c0_g2_i11:208-960(-)